MYFNLIIYMNICIYLLYPYIYIYRIYSIYTSIHECFFSTPVALCSKSPRPLVAYMIREVECFEPLWVDDSDSFFLLTIYPEKQK